MGRDTDIWVGKILPNRDLIGSLTYGGNSFDGAEDVVIDEDEFIYVVGYVREGYPQFQNAFITKISLDCKRIIWHKSFGDWRDDLNIVSDDVGRAILIDNEGNLIIMGWTGRKSFLFKLDKKEGNLLKSKEIKEEELVL